MAYTTEGFKPLRQQLRLEGGVEATTTAVDITLTGRSANFQAIDPTASGVALTLPAEESSGGLVFWIANVGSVGEAVSILTDAPAIVTTLKDGSSAVVACDGSAWSILSESDPYPGLNDETLTGDLTLGSGAVEYHRLDPGGASRDVNLPAASGLAGRSFHFSNFADAAENLVIGGVVTINQNEAVRIVSDGSAWVPLGVYTIALT